MNTLGHVLLSLAVVIIAAILLFSPGSTRPDTWYTWKVVALVLAILGLLLEIIPYFRR
jgi:hypothetical protein